MAEQSEGCTCEWTAGSSIMPGTTRTPAASRITDPDCPVHGSDTDPSPDPVLSKVAAERDHYKQRLEAVREWAEAVLGNDGEMWYLAQQVLFLLDQTDERKSEPFIPAVDTRDLVPAFLLSEIAGEIQLALSEHGTYQDLIERLEAIVRDHSTPEEGCTCGLRPGFGPANPNCPVHGGSTPEEGK